MARNVSAIYSAFRTFALAQGKASGLNALSSQVVWGAGSGRTEPWKPSLLCTSVAVPVTALVRPKDTHLHGARRAVWLPSPLPRGARVLPTFPRSYKKPGAGILTSGSTAQLGFSLLCSRTNPRRLIPLGAISPVPGEGGHPAPGCCCSCLLPARGCRRCSVLCQRICWGSALSKAGPALTSHLSYSFASHKPFLSTPIFLLSHFSKTLTHITTSYTNQTAKNRNTIYSQLKACISTGYFVCSTPDSFLVGNAISLSSSSRSIMIGQIPASGLYSKGSAVWSYE